MNFMLLDEIHVTSLAKKQAPLKERMLHWIEKELKVIPATIHTHTYTTSTHTYTSVFHHTRSLKMRGSYTFNSIRSSKT